LISRPLVSHLHLQLQFSVFVLPPQFLFNLIILSFVRGLAWANNNDALERAFSPFGEIIESKGRLTLVLSLLLDLLFLYVT
ncbi:unnamed protein product, partial [Prunus brigantina]